MVGKVALALVLSGSTDCPCICCRIYLYPNDFERLPQHQFWQTVMKGAKAAADKYRVVMTFEGPPTEADIHVYVHARQCNGQEPIGYLSGSF